MKCRRSNWRGGPIIKHLLVTLGKQVAFVQLRNRVLVLAMGWFKVNLIRGVIQDRSSSKN